MEKIINKNKSVFIKRYSTILGLFIVISILLMSIGFSALNTKLSISGEANFRIDEEIRITGIKVLNAENNAYETYNSKYSKNSITSFSTLPEQNSTLTFEVTIENKSEKRYLVEDIIETYSSNPNIKYETIDIEKGNIIDKNTEKFIKIKMSYLNTQGDNHNSSLELKFNFVEYNIEPPILQGEKVEWVATAPIISIQTPGTATDGIKNYEYYLSDLDQTPTTDMPATGTTDNNVLINTEGTSYIWYRTISNYGYKSDWSSPQIVKFSTEIYTMTNLIKNGSFEEELNDWDTTEETIGISQDSYHGSYSNIFNVTTNNHYTADMTQMIDSPILNHKYYGSLMFKSSNTFGLGYGDVFDTRFEYRCNDEEGGLMIFAKKLNKTTDWIKLSSIESITTETYLSCNWVIRNFQRGANEPSYSDALILVDLTETFGAGNEPSKEWCDKYINYFDGTTTATRNGISMPLVIENKRISLDTTKEPLETIKVGDTLEYTFVISADDQPSSIDFNDVNLTDVKIEATDNNKYKITGNVTITSYMLAGLDEREYDYTIHRFFDINVAQNLVIEAAIIINHSYFYE